MKLSISINVKSEYHIGSGMQKPGVTDSSLFARPDGSLVIPAEHLRGITRDACTTIIYWLKRSSEFCEASLTKENKRTGLTQTCGLNFFPAKDRCLLCRLFGTSFTPRRYHFNDAEPELNIKAKSRISFHNHVDMYTGRVPENTFFSFELGSCAVFSSYIEVPTNPDEELGLLLAGLRLVQRVGGKSNRGWGESRILINDLIGKNSKGLNAEKLIENYILGNSHGSAS